MTETSKLLLLSEAAPLMPASYWTMHKFCTKGTKAGVFLKYEMIGSRHYTTVEWMAEFRAECKSAREKLRESRKPPAPYGGMRLHTPEEARARIEALGPVKRRTGGTR